MKIKNWILGGTFTWSTKSNDPLNAKFYIFQIQSNGSYKLVQYARQLSIDAGRPGHRAAPSRVEPRTWTSSSSSPSTVSRSGASTR